MSISPIMKALAMGYAAPQVLQFVANAFPSLAPRIQKAQSTGYSVEKILKMLNRGMGGGDELDNLTESQIHTRRDAQQNQLGQDIAKAGVGAATTLGLGRAIPGIAQGIRGAFGGGNQPPPPPIQATPGPQSPIGPQPMANAPVHTNPIPPVGPTQGNIPTPAPGVNPVQPPAPPSPKHPWSNLPPEQSVAILKEMGLEQRIKNLTGAGNHPDVVADALNAGLTPGQRKWFGDKLKAGQTKPLQELVNDYLSTQPSGEQGEQTLKVPNASKEIPAQQIRPVLEPSGQKLDEAAKATQGKMQKGEMVFDEQSGISGNIKDIKNREALIDDNGKVHKVKVEDLERAPEDVIKAAQDLLKIPEVDRSSIISLVTYRPTTKQMFVQYHNGETYVYEDIPQERVDEISQAMGIPVTTGKNMFGAWEQGKKDSRGAALIHGILRDPRYAKDQEGKTWEKIGTFYDYWSALRKPSKKKKK